MSPDNSLLDHNPSRTLPPDDLVWEKLVDKLKVVRLHFKISFQIA
jgi:hypothetical protein